MGRGYKVCNTAAGKTQVAGALKHSGRYDARACHIHKLTYSEPDASPKVCIQGQYGFKLLKYINFEITFCLFI